MSKALSTGTLSLRFMQNAHRRKNLAQVELQRAEIKDESKWEVGQEIKDAWGIGKEAQKEDSVEFETSYLPFLFPAEHEDVGKPLGRRMFNKKGEDVSQSQTQNHTTDDHLEGNDDAEEGELAPESTTPKNEKPRTEGRKFRVHAKPKSISSESGRNLRGFEALDQPKKESRKSHEIAPQKSAREAVFGSLSGVGIDLRAAKHMLEHSEEENAQNSSSPVRQTKQNQRQKQPIPPTLSKGFLKPSGIDAPASRKPATTSPSIGNSPKSRTSSIIEGARKRPRDSDDASDGNKKRSKKKRLAADQGTPVPS